MVDELLSRLRAAGLGRPNCRKEKLNQQRHANDRIRKPGGVADRLGEHQLRGDVPLELHADRLGAH
eukprot:6994832-Alexandrium_andersonii.AAC.1